MPAAEYPFQVFGRVPVVRAPAEIDIATCGDLRRILLQWYNRGHATVVVDLTGTVFCDLAGLGELMRAHQRAAAGGGGLRLVTPAGGAFARIFALTGVDAVIPRFATVKNALAHLPAAAGPPHRDPAAAPTGPSAHARARDISLVAGSRHCEHPGGPAAEASMLAWSIAAMSDATARLPAVRAWDRPQALAAIGEAVWWITMVDATLVRYYPRAYGTMLAGHAPAERPLIEDTLAGLRFVRNWVGLDDIIAAGPHARRITHWTWNPVAESALAWLPPRAQAWERTRWRSYQACLAGHTIGKSLSRAEAFLTLTGGADAVR